MSRENLQKWYVAGLQAYKSACEQGIQGAQEAIEKATEPKLKHAAEKAVKTLTEHSENIDAFLAENGSEATDFRDQIMDGINRGTTLMLKAADDEDVVDLALISGGTVAFNYFMVAFANHAPNAKMLDMKDQAKKFKHMADEQEDLLDEYNKIGKRILKKLAE